MGETPVRLDDGVIVLRAWEPKDAEAVFAACQDPEIARFVPIPQRHQRAEHRVEFGYWLAPQARGRGIATRALCLIAEWSLAQGLLRLELFTDPDNAASGAVARRAGFDFEGVRRAWDTDRDGNPEDGLFYVRIAGGPT